MKNFHDLTFKHRPFLGSHATIDFDNGYGVSVITGNGSYTSPGAPYEIAITYKGELCYDTPITDDVLGHQTEEDVSDVMRAVQLLPA